MYPTYLITGVTGGLGSEILSTLLAEGVPPSTIIASSSRESARAEYEKKGVRFRRVDYDDEATLKSAFKDVDKLFFVSSSIFDVPKRVAQHQSVINAAKETGAGQVFYSSLALGGYRSDSKVDVQQAHLHTEEMLKKSGINYTSVREGLYAEAFPLFLNWFPSTTEIPVPEDGPMAFASRKELGEATAKLMMQGGHEREIVLFTGPKAYTFDDLVSIINRVTHRNVKITRVSPEEYVRRNAENDIGGKAAGFFEKKISWFEGSTKGDASLIDPTMEQVLGRKPKDAETVITELLTADRDYTWHQNYAK